jgi:hypothetical protein
VKIICTISRGSLKIEVKPLVTSLKEEEAEKFPGACIAKLEEKLSRIYCILYIYIYNLTAGVFLPVR